MGKHKRYKRVRKHLEFYKLNFALTPPYKLAVDGEFIQQCLRYKIHIKEQIPKLFQNTVVPCVTKCTVSRLRRAGNQYSGAAIIAKRFERIQCSHEKGVKKEEECLRALVGKRNELKICFGAQVVSLRNSIRKVPAAPLLYIREGVPIFEAPSKASQYESKEKSSAKVGLSSTEKKKVQEAIEEEKGKQEKLLRRKRKGPREPNPLSRKKKKTHKVASAPKKDKKESKPEVQAEITVQKEKTVSDAERLRRMRRRRRGKKKKKASLEEKNDGDGKEDKNEFSLGETEQ